MLRTEPLSPTSSCSGSICSSRSRACLGDLVVCIFYKTTQTFFFSNYIKDFDLYGNQKLEKKLSCSLASVTEPSLLGIVHTESPGSTLAVGVMPPISGDPMPHGLCSSPALQWGSAPHGCCIPCHKSTFLHNRGTEKWSVTSGSRWVGCGSVIVEFQTSPSASSKHPYWWRCCFPEAV